MTIPADTKDWTWVLERRCRECDVDARSFGLRDVPAALRGSIVRWRPVLDRADVRDRPNADTWSPLEYAAHVRDVFGVFEGRLERMVAEEDPEFENWDQDAAAVAGRYSELDPHTVADELAAAGEHLARVLEAVPESAVDRPGRRSNGSVFTVLTLARYLLHDDLHHLHDVRA
ncbi:DinB family protein [Planctomonas psychrotolerans]|uniref:DinB family protein n=1 Tax=Planctomonas psychrotolerans TaxID=2528712 RepID=UPI001239FECB|nr:DinB family protein [Planctomonas psychrotolerans]